MSKPSDGMICFRLSPEIRAAVLDLCATQQISASELYRGLTNVALGGQPYGIAEGYMQARAYAVHLVHGMLHGMLEQMPESFDEAVARFGLSSPRIE